MNQTTKHLTRTHRAVKAASKATGQNSQDMDALLSSILGPGDGSDPNLGGSDGSDGSSQDASSSAPAGNSGKPDISLLSEIVYESVAPAIGTFSEKELRDAVQAGVDRAFKPKTAKAGSN